MNYRRVVHLQVVAAIMVIAVIGWMGCRLVAPPAMPPLQALAGLAWLYALPLAVAIFAVMFQRARSPDAILGYRASPAARTLREAILQNTLEQTVLGVLALVAFAAQVPAASSGLLPVAAWLFLAGRLLFAVGYALSPMWRFFGYALNFYASLALLAGAVCLAVGH